MTEKRFVIKIVYIYRKRVFVGVGVRGVKRFLNKIM